MSKPLPILRCNLATQEELFYRLYEIGMQFGNHADAEDGWRQFVGFHAMQLVWADSLDQIDGVGARTDEEDAEWYEGRTLVNSVEQFVAYMEALRAERFKQRLDAHGASYAD